MYTGVIWQPYTQAAVHERYPDGISLLCTRDRDYWMTKSKIIFDVFVEEMAQQSVMRQFGLRQLVEAPCTEAPVPPLVHRYCVLVQCLNFFLNCPLWSITKFFYTHNNFRMSRKGISRTEVQWLQRLQPYVTEWATATTRLWDEDHGFDIGLFNAYLAQYMHSTRICIIHHSTPDDIPAPAMRDMYSIYDTFGSRQYAVTYILFMYCIFVSPYFLMRT